MVCSIMPQLVSILIPLVLLIVKNEAARILAVFPTPSISHQVVFRPLTQELAKRGHEVVVITTDPAFPKGEAPANLTEIDVHDVSYKIWREGFLTAPAGKKQDLAIQIKVAIGLLLSIFVKQMKSNETQTIIGNENETFDLLLLEACVRPALVLSHFYKVPVIQVSSFGGIFGNFETIGAPTHPLLYPSPLRQRIYNLTFWEKLSELYNYYAMENVFNSHEEIENELLRRSFGRNIPALSELSNNVHMLFLNIHSIWEGNHPVPPGVIYMGGMHQKPEKKLPQDLESYLNSSVNGVIYISFGTNVSPSLLPPEKIQMLVRVFSQLPYDILWKWDKDELPGQTKNIKISKWFPQSDLLRHPNIQLFITQGGLQSTDESITAGVPLVGIPMIGDQWFNTEKYVYHKIGLKLDMETLTDAEFKKAINTVINDKSYRRNIAKLRALMLDQPQRPLERAVWWTEHVLRHGGARHLRAPAANMSWSEYLELELWRKHHSRSVRRTHDTEVKYRVFFSKMKANQHICNIKPVLLARFIFGYYHDFSSTTAIRLLSKLYCLIIAVFLICAVNMVPGHDNEIFQCIEYSCYIVISMYYKEEYLLSYYRRIPHVDRLPCSKKIFHEMWKKMKCFVMLLVAMRFLETFLLCYGNIENCVDTPLATVIANVLFIAIFAGRIMISLIFPLLYCRIKIIRTTLEICGFNNTPLNRFKPRRYIEMYQTVLNSIEKIKFPTNLLIFIYLAYSFNFLCKHIYSRIGILKENGLDFFNLFMLVERCLHTCMFVMVPIISLDLVAGEINEIKIIIIDKRIASTSERERSEIQLFFNTLRNEPLDYTLWRFVPLNMRTLLGYLSFCVTTFIAVLQIKDTVV